MITDTHCHVLSDKYFNVYDVIDRLDKDNIKRIIINGYDGKSNKEVIRLVNNKNVFGALGVHPDNIEDFTEENIEFIKNNLGNDGIIAIGEIGLDYYHNDLNKDEQIRMFEYFLNLAEELDLPVIIHNRDATGDMLSILKKHKCRGIIHCFSGSIEVAREYIKMGYKLGIGGVITFKNSKLKDALKEIGLEHVLLETDSPYLTPVPLRGVYNEPYNLNYVFKFLCELFKVSEEELASKLENNYKEVFK